MMSNCQVRFLGEGDTATCASLPDESSGSRKRVADFNSQKINIPSHESHTFDKIRNTRMWRNWYTRTFEGRVALPCEFESRHPHCLISEAIALLLSREEATNALQRDWTTLLRSLKADFIERLKASYLSH